MPLGVNVRNRVAPPSSGSVPTLIDTLFLAGAASGGVNVDVTKPFSSPEDWANVYGARDATNAAAYDYIDTFLREGGNRVYFTKYTAVNGTPLQVGAPILAALGAFGEELGAGQVALASEPPSAGAWAALDAHAQAFNRFALRQLAKGRTRDQRASDAASFLTGDASQEFGLTVGDWVIVPALPVAGAEAREVPGTAFVAGAIARCDAQGNPNAAPAGPDFPFQYAVDIVGGSLRLADVETLLNAGVNSLARVYGIYSLYGFQTSTPPSETTPFWQANCVRARMWLTQQAKAVLQPFVFKQIDGRGRLLLKMKTVLDRVCLNLYGVDGLYGETPQEAFATTFGLNNDTTASQGLVNVAVEARFSEHAKGINVDLVTVPVKGVVSTASQGA